MKYVVITATHHVRLDDGPLELDDLQVAVGGWIEALPHTLGSDIVVWGNEEGKPKDLPVATVTNRLLGGIYAGGEDEVRGDVVICGIDESGASIGLTDEQVTRFMRLAVERGAERVE